MALKGISPLTGDEMVVFDAAFGVEPEEYTRLVKRYESNAIKLLKEKFHTPTHFPVIRTRMLYCSPTGNKRLQFVLVSINHPFWVTTLNFSFYRIASKDVASQIIEAIEIAQNTPNLNPVDYVNGKRSEDMKRASWFALAAR